MAAVRVQNYLKKHKIGPLFESLMAQVIQDTPEDPIGYIIKVLQGIHKKQSKQLDNSFNGHLSPRPSSRNSSRSEKKGNERRSHPLAASWSAGIAQEETRKHENQLKTWTGNDFQSAKNKTWSSNNRRDEPQPQWNNDTRVPTHDFDELFQMQNGGETQIRTSQISEKYRGARSWETQDKQPSAEKISFQPSGNDELSQELRLKSRSSTTSVTSDPASPITPGTRPAKTSRRAVEKHRKELQALLLEGDDAGRRRTGVGKHSPEERGTEILERMEDLQNEGVKASQSLTGAKLNKLKRDGNKDVSVTICARCARIIGDKDDILSQAASSDFNSRLFDDFTKKNQDFDNIDSASEASENMVFNRENNAWSTSDSELDETTPRNNTVSFDRSFNAFPRKESKHIFKSSDNTDDDSLVQTQRSSRSRRSDFDFSNTAKNSGWRLDGNESDESETDVTKRRSARSQASSSIKGRAWNRNSGNTSDDDSIIT